MEIWSRMLPLLVIGGFAIAAWWWNRKTSAQNADYLNVVRRAPLLRGAVLAVIEVSGRHFLIGATEQRIEMLAEFDEDSFAVMDDGDTPNEPWTDLFARARTLVRRDDLDHGFDDQTR